MLQYHRTHTDEDDVEEDDGSVTEHTAFTKIMLNTRLETRGVNSRANRSF